MPKARINGIELYYESHGEGPAITFAHGRGGNHLSWWRQVTVFAQHYRCITFDHRGWGASFEPSGGPGRSAFVEDLKQLLDYLEIPQTFLVAQSMGGLTCLEFAMTYPKRTSGLVLADTTGGIGDATVVDLLLDVHPPNDSLRRALSPGFIQEHPDLTFLFGAVGRLNPAMPTDAVSAFFRDPSGPHGGDLADFRVPTLVVAGEKDLIFPVNVMRAAQQLLPNSRLEIVPGAAHSTHYEQAEVFNNLVGDFFAGIRENQALVASDD